ncbi:MAG TPA: ABC transporter permease [Vicinamibacterales bacterium]|nr:ABC transporter permease [Vicinamibacterales bacterium]
MKWRDAARAHLRLLIARRAAESRMNQEFRLHVELETEKLMREHGLAPDAARRRALVAFGGVEKHKEALRDDRGFVWLGSFSLDLRLAIRMLARYPALTLVGCAAMAFGIAAAVAVFELRNQMVAPSLPLDQGSRIVGFRNWDASLTRPVPATSYDFATWRDVLTSIEDLSAVSLFPRNLITDAGQSEAVDVAAMTASAFRMARVLPELGRTLLEADEEPGAPPVIVIGHDIWKRRFSGDREVVGRTVRLGGERRTVAGVMPEGFAFPAVHGIWIPLRVPAVGSAPGDGPGLLVFGRLARGASRERAQAELLAIGQRDAVGVPETREHVRPQLVPYAWLFFDPSGIQLGLALGNIFVVMLLVLVAANVALLMFARAATRESEIAVRSALGASRARIVAQLFVEGLVLAGLAVIVGLVAARVGVRSLLAMMEANSGRSLPFWVGDGLAPTTLIYAGTLTLLSAALISVLPALKITSRGLEARLRQSTAGGGGFRFGGVWTLVIASQVAATLTFPAASFFFHRWVVEGQTRDVGFPAARYLSARLQLDRESASGVPMDTTELAFRSRLRRTYAELERRVMSEPEVAGLTFADRLPGTLHPRWRIEVDGEALTTSAPGHPVSSASVAPNFFDVVGAPILAGRAFAAADVDSASAAVIVNQSFVTQVLGGRHPVGRRIRRVRVDDTPTAGPWLDIVGVVRDLGMVEGPAGLYLPIAPEAAPVLRIAIGVRSSSESFAARFRAVANEVEPTLQIHELMRLDDAWASGWLESQYMSRVLALLSAIALLLSLTAIYSVVSFTVSRRTQEIGVRVALGADRRRVIAAVLRRPLAQVGLGNVAGAILVAVMFVGPFESTPSVVETASIAAYAVLMMGVCLLACVVPTRRALRVEPASALRVER